MTECALCGAALDAGVAHVFADAGVDERIPCCLDCYRAFSGDGGGER